MYQMHCESIIFIQRQKNELFSKKIIILVTLKKIYEKKLGNIIAKKMSLILTLLS